MRLACPTSEARNGRLWSTRRVPANEQFAYWREVICEAFTPLEPTRVDTGAFHGEVVAQPLGPGAISRISSQAQRVNRTDRLIRQRDDGVTYLNLQVSGCGGVTQDGRSTALEPGDFALVDSSRPFELVFEEDFEQICLTLPNERVAPRLGIPELATARRVAGRDGVGAVIGDLVRSLSRQASTLDRQAAVGALEPLVGLLTLALATSPPAPVPAGRELLLRAALRQALASLADPDLSPAVVAAEIGVSTNYLHRLFAQHGKTFGRWLLEQRLARCHQDLAHPYDDRTIAEIAHAWGFRHQAHFSRTFTERYGITPSRHRRQSWQA